MRLCKRCRAIKKTTVLQDLSLAGKVVVITGLLTSLTHRVCLVANRYQGGASGIGLALSQGVTEVGALVAAIGAANEPDAEFSKIFEDKLGIEVRYYR